MSSTQTTNMPILAIEGLSKSFKHNEDQDRLVLEDINLTVEDGEIVALLGRSGSGKSTLLRIISGLSRPTAGQIKYRNKNIDAPTRGIAMVFQDFALLPWLTVLQNVELGLEALGIPQDVRRERALKTIDLIGLDGFESAYPRELSGGMCQRVGIARALVVNPDMLLMDEPFSALDVLTAENLRSDLLDLWQSKKTETNGILFVTHDIEEALLMANRIIIFGHEPTTIRSELTVGLSYPRKPTTPRFRGLVDRIYTLMTTTPGLRLPDQFEHTATHIGYRLPDADIPEIMGLLEASTAPEHSGKKIDLPKLADELHLDLDALFPLTEALELLRLALVTRGDITITPIGRMIAEADILDKKKLFAKQLLKHIPLARHIRLVLDERSSHTASSQRFLTEIEDYLSEEEAERVLEVVIDWGRYAELYAFDSNTGILNLENP